MPSAPEWKTFHWLLHTLSCYICANPLGAKCLQLLKLWQTKLAIITSRLYHEKGLRSNPMSVTSRCKLLTSRLLSKIGDTSTTRRYCLINTIRFLSNPRDHRDHSCSENDEATLYVHVSISKGVWS